MNETTYSTSSRTKYLLVAVVVVLAFFAAYGIASGRVAQADAQTASATPAGYGGGGGTGTCEPSLAVSGECGGNCCGGESEPIESSAVRDGDIQRVSVDLSAGYFDPNIIYVEAGVPIEITFGEGTGCMAEVMFKDFAVFENLTNGGATIELPALDAGEYEFSCGMEMVFGTVIAE